VEIDCFFFQAEDGIRDGHVTGVQTCALPISVVALAREDDREIASLATETIAIPPVPELLSPILTVVPLQLFTYHLALVRRVNPDTMRGDQPAHGRALAGLAL